MNYPQINMTEGLYLTQNPTQAAIWARISDQPHTGKIVGYSVLSITVERKAWEAFKLLNPGVLSNRSVSQPPVKTGVWEETVIPLNSIRSFNKLGPILATPPTK